MKESFTVSIDYCESLNRIPPFPPSSIDGCFICNNSWQTFFIACCYKRFSLHGAASCPLHKRSIAFPSHWLLPIYTYAPGWSRVFRNSNEFLLHMWHPSCYSCYKPGDKSWTKKGLDADYDKFNQVATVKSDNFNLTTGNPSFSSFLVSSNTLSQNHDRNHKECWNVATYKWKIQNGKI